MIEKGLEGGGGGGGRWPHSLVDLYLLTESRLPRADCESGPSRSDLRAPASDLGFTFLTGAVQICPCCALCVRP